MGSQLSQTAQRRGQLAAWGMVLVGLAAIGLEIYLLRSVLYPSLDAAAGSDSIRSMRMTFLSVGLLPVGIVVLMHMAFEAGRRDRWPFCAACRTALYVLPKESVAAGHCYSCGGLLSDMWLPTGETSVGLDRAEFVRRCQWLNTQFWKRTNLGTAAIVVFAAVCVGLGLWANPDTEIVPWFGGWRTVGALYAGYSALLAWALISRQRQTRALGLRCACGHALPNSIPTVVTTGHCPKCHISVVRI